MMLLIISVQSSVNIESVALFPNDQSSILVRGWEEKKKRAKGLVLPAKYKVNDLRGYVYKNMNRKSESSDRSPCVGS